MGRNTIQLETAVSTISQEYLLEFTSEYGILEDVHPELPGPEDRIVDFSEGWMLFSKRPGKNTPQCYTKPLDSLKNWSNIFLWVDERVFPTAVDWRTHAPQDEMPAANTYSKSDVAMLNTSRTPIQKQPEILLCLVGLSQRYFLEDDVYPTYLHDDDRDMDLFNLISVPNPSKVKTGLRLRVAHEVPLLTATASQVIDMEDPDAATESSGTPSVIEKSSLDFDNENPASLMTEGKGLKDQAQEIVAPKILLLGNMPAIGAASEVREEEEEEEVAALEPRASKKCGRMGNDRGDANATPKVLRKDYASVCPKQSTRGGKSLLMMRSYEIPTGNVATMEVQDTYFVESAGSGKSTSSPSMVGSPREIYQPRWGVTNSCRLDTSNACQDVIDHIVTPGYFFELRHMPNVEFLSQYNKNLAQQEIQGLQNQTSNLKTLLKAETDMKKAAETKNADLTKELKSLRS
nr:transposase (putative), gypsy type [Tanacetum cinerariifolium]